MKKKVNKKAPVLIVVLLIVGILLYVNHESKGRVIGEMEAVIVPEITEVQGKIVEMRVEVGQQVKEGDILAVIDPAEQAYAVEQLELSLEQAILQSKSAVTGEGSALLSAQSAYNSARLSAQEAENSYEKAERLYAEGAISESERTQTQVAAAAAEKSLAAARGALNDAGAVFARENSELGIRALQSRLQQAREQLEKCTIRASCDGTVITRSCTAGNVVPAGSDLIEVAKEGGRLFDGLSAGKIDLFAGIRFSADCPVQRRGL